MCILHKTKQDTSATISAAFPFGHRITGTAPSRKTLYSEEVQIILKEKLERRGKGSSQFTNIYRGMILKE